jgi:hypothetical protein
MDPARRAATQGILVWLNRHAAEPVFRPSFSQIRELLQAQREPGLQKSC